MSAYLVAYLEERPASAERSKAHLLGLDIFSEESPTVTGRRRTALVLAWPGENYAVARAGLIAHLEKTAPWLLPERNGGRK